MNATFCYKPMKSRGRQMLNRDIFFFLYILYIHSIYRLDILHTEEHIWICSYIVCRHNDVVLSIQYFNTIFIFVHISVGFFLQFCHLNIHNIVLLQRHIG